MPPSATKNKRFLTPTAGQRRHLRLNRKPIHFNDRKSPRSGKQERPANPSRLSGDWLKSNPGGNESQKFCHFCFLNFILHKNKLFSLVPGFKPSISGSVVDFSTTVLHPRANFIENFAKNDKILIFLWKKEVFLRWILSTKKEESVLPVKIIGSATLVLTTFVLIEVCSERLVLMWWVKSECFLL